MAEARKAHYTHYLQPYSNLWFAPILYEFHLRQRNGSLSPQAPATVYDVYSQTIILKAGKVRLKKSTQNIYFPHCVGNYNRYLGIMTIYTKDQHRVLKHGRLVLKRKNCGPLEYCCSYTPSFPLRMPFTNQTTQASFKNSSPLYCSSDRWPPFSNQFETMICGSDS